MIIIELIHEYFIDFTYFVLMFKSSRPEVFCKKGVLNPIQDGGKKPPPPPTSFSPVASTNVGFSLQTFWHLVLTLLPHCCKISSSCLLPVQNCWTITKTTPQKKQFFLSNPYKIEVMITFLIEMLQLPNFGHMTTSMI